MSTGTITRIVGGRPARRTTLREASVPRLDFESTWPPRASVIVLAVANAAIAAALFATSLALFG
ncbi:hypothetical protein ACFUTX_00565 [Microbacterium sp. NPDC057407]|uniref:hypothetical protein n=1 Tax=Microbacterium sp. NPDC057407 TaxID=3346120 RepID=UPI0036726B67